MKPLEEMTVSQIDGYAKEHGIDLGSASTKQDKINEIKIAEATVKHVCVSGIEVDIDMSVFDDLDLIDMMDDFQNGDAFKFKKILKRVFRDQSDGVFCQLKNAEGVVTITKASEFFVELMEEVQAKN